jgi:hypothetical protein
MPARDARELLDRSGALMPGNNAGMAAHGHWETPVIVGFAVPIALRWKSEVIVSDGRAYLISGDPALLSKVQEATRRFSEIISALRQQPLSDS